MTLETTPVSISTEGNYRIKFVDVIAGAAITAAEFDGGDDLTYSFTPTGWNPVQSQATVTDERLTLPQILERPGKKTKSLSVQYVVSATGGATAVLVEGTAGFIVIRPNVANATAGAAAQKVVVWPILCGEQMADPPVANGVDTTSQPLFVTGAVTRQTMAA